MLNKDSLQWWCGWQWDYQVMKKCKTNSWEKPALLLYTSTKTLSWKFIKYSYSHNLNFFQHYFRHLGSIYKILKVALGFSLFSRPTLLHEYCTPTGIGGLTCAQVFLVRNGAKIVLCLFTVFICSFYNDLQEYFCIF